jgi:uncharacterized integral membrane protein
MQTKLIIGTVFAIIIAIFSIQNAIPVSISFFSWNFKTSLVVVVLGSLAVGVIIMGIFSSIKQLRQRNKIKKLERLRERLQEDIDQFQEKVEDQQNEIDKIKKVSERNKEDNLKQISTNLKDNSNNELEDNINNLNSKEDDNN